MIDYVYRGRKLHDSIIKADSERGDFRYLVAEPGDATRYELLVAAPDPATLEACHESPGSIIVTQLNLSNGPSSMFIRVGTRLSWRDIHEGLGIDAAGSCYFITVFLSYIYQGIRCETEEEFQASWEEKAHE